MPPASLSSFKAPAKRQRLPKTSLAGCWLWGRRAFTNCSRPSNELWRANASRQRSYLVELVNPASTPSILDAPPAAESLQSVAPADAAVSRPTTLWLIRHAEVEERYQNVFGGRIDMDLSRRGHAQAEALGRYLKSQKVDALYASPMKRVHQTLAPWLADGSIEPIVRPEFREVDFGDWTGSHWTEVQAKYGISALAWLDQLECGGIPNAEDARGFRARVEPALRELLNKQAGRHLAV